MSKVKLDRIDRKILNDLQDKGRMTNVELAERAGVSRTSVWRRVRALEESGIIRGYHADINPGSLGYGISVFTYVGLSNQSESDLRKFEELANTWSLVRECYLVSGESDYVLKIIAEDWDSYQKFLTKYLLPASNVQHVKSALSVRVAKYKPGVPIETE